MSVAFCRINQISELLEHIMTWTVPMKHCIKAWTKNKNIGLRDRIEITNITYKIIRNLRFYINLCKNRPGKLSWNLAILGVATESTFNNIKLVFFSFNNNELSWIRESVDILKRNQVSTDFMYYSVPCWLYNSLSKLENHLSLLQALNQQATFDFRVNPLKLKRNTFLLKLKQSNNDYFFEQSPYSPFGIKSYGKKPNITEWNEFKNGSLEVQDEGSQLLALLVRPKPHQIIIDFCSGSGGKALLIAALMKSSGTVYAFDTSERMISKCKNRVEKSGLKNIIPVLISDENDKKIERFFNKADTVIVDVPCSGSGVIRRSPELKWRYTYNDIQAFLNKQDKILRIASTCVKIQGAMVYCTCSVLPEENDERISNFLANNKEFKLINISNFFKNLSFNTPFIHLRPDLHKTDGFFGAILKKYSA